ncbi:MAG: DUF2634 domain-containing protein [Lachnospiraceae bacterium]|nr:DUF2634 domain-containing protein [Lachnospiraceae bacterium]
MLFPVVEVPEFLPESSEYDTEYRRSVKWDPAAGDFVRDGANRMVECGGQEAFAVWCYKIAQTERYHCLAYPDSIGSEMERALDNDDEKTVESMAQRTITEALMVNPRTEAVWDFSFSWDGDNMHCTFKVKGIHWDAEIVINI